jgi:hypothetical protein
MHPDKAYPFIIFMPLENPGGRNLPREAITKTEKVNPRNLSELLSKVAQALANIGRDEGDYLIQSSYLFYNPAGNGKTIHIPQYLIDQYKEKGKN